MLEGTEYTNCEKKAVFIQSRGEHKPWYALKKEILFSNPAPTNYYKFNSTYVRTLRPFYG